MDSIAVAGLVVGTVGAIAAAIAAWLAGLAPTRTDLKRVEKNTADTAERVSNVEVHIKSVDERLREQHARELTEAAARMVSISVRGDQEYGQPVQMIFTLAGSDATLTSIDMLNEVGTLFGSASCTETAPHTFTASVDDSVARRWHGAGTVDNAISHRVVMRAHILIEGREAKRDFAVYLRNTLKQTPHGFQGYYLTLEGNC